MKSNFEDERDDNVCIDYINGKHIFVGESGELLFMEEEEQVIELGEAIDSKYLKSIDELSKKEQLQIIAALNS